MWRYWTLVLSVAASTGAIAAAAQATVAPPPQPDFAPVQESKPALRVVHAAQPVIIRGLHFKAGEQVRLTGSVNSTKVARTLRSNLVGTFNVNFGYEVSLAGCSAGASLKAVGNLGSVAILKIPPRMCAPAATP